MSASSAQLRKEAHTAGSGGWAILVGLGALFLLALIGWGVWAGIVEPNTRHAEQTQAARVAAENQAVIETSLAKTQLALQVTLPAEPILPTYTPAMLPSATASPTFQPTYPAGMVLIPAGSFRMGEDADDALAECQKFRNDCSRDWFTNEEPLHEVSLGEFYLDPYEVSNAQFAAFLNVRGNQEEGGVTWLESDSGYVKIKGEGFEWQADSGYADHPVVEVSWYGAKAYCEWIRGRLPTEAEWEYAARGGLDGRLYPWGDESPVCQADAENGARFDDNADCDDIGTALVGSYAPNGYGLYDMAGNVWEWVSSLYQPYPYDAQGGREDLSASGSRVLRGGSWDYYASSLRVAARPYGDPTSRSSNIGFRCAFSP